MYMRTWCSGLCGVVREKKNTMGGGKSMGKGTDKGKTKFGSAGKKPTRQNTHTYSAKQTQFMRKKIEGEGGKGTSRDTEQRIIGGRI